MEIITGSSIEIFKGLHQIKKHLRCFSEFAIGF